MFLHKKMVSLGVLPKLSNINSKDNFATNPIAIEDVLGENRKYITLSY